MTLRRNLGLQELYSALGTPAVGEGRHAFNALTIPNFGRYRLARDATGSPALLVQGSSVGIPPAPTRLQHLLVSYNLLCVVSRDSGSREEGVFTIIQCLDADSMMTAYFLRVLEAILACLGQDPSSETVQMTIENVVRLFQPMNEVPRKHVQGLWAELFVIAQSGNPSILVDAWHRLEGDLYDFGDSAQRVEVKSTELRGRAHHFSLAQLSPPSGIELVVASVTVRRTGQGHSVADLTDRVTGRIGDDPSRVLRLHQVVVSALGSAWRQASAVVFDLDEARRSLAFYDPREIPRLPPELPTGVSQVHFVADLSGKKALSSGELRESGGLIRSLTRG
jgi:hypothetical protein